MEAERTSGHLLFVPEKRQLIEVPPHQPFYVQSLEREFARVGKNFMKMYGGVVEGGTRIPTFVEINTLSEGLSITGADLIKHLQVGSAEVVTGGFECSFYDLCFVRKNFEHFLSRRAPNFGLVPDRVDILMEKKGWGIFTHWLGESIPAGSRIITSRLYKERFFVTMAQC